MQINITQNWEGKEVKIEYRDADSFDDLPRERCKQVYGVCFVGDRMVIGRRIRNDKWGLIGGSVEKGETFTEALAREVKEESNMRVLKAVPIGYQKVTPPDSEPFYQLRFCVLVEPLGEFVKDTDGNPDSGIAEIKLIEPEKHKEYFDWGEIGERVIQRGMELRAKP